MFCYAIEGGHGPSAPRPLGTATEYEEGKRFLRTNNIQLKRNAGGRGEDKG